MQWRVGIMVAASASMALAAACANAGQTTNPTVLMKTSAGDIKIELYRDKAPITVENFLAYVNQKFYDGTIFHRVIPNFMIQGGGLDKNMKRKETKDPIKIEADNGLKNEVGTVAMARTSNPNSATSQFFINVRDNVFLNHRDKSAQGWGYTVFGKVVEGMDVVKKIENAPTTQKEGRKNVPVDPILIKSVRAIP